MENYKKNTGKRLYTLRKKRKLQVNEVIERLGIARSTYNNYEAGNRSPKGERLVQLADLLNTTVDYLTGKTDDDSQKVIDINELANYKYTDNGKELPIEKQAALAEIIKSLLK